MIDNLLASGATRIVINLEHVNYVDSAGLGALIETHRKTKAQGGRLMLCKLGPKLRQALEIARLKLLRLQVSEGRGRCRIPSSSAGPLVPRIGSIRRSAKDAGRLRVD